MDLSLAWYRGRRVIIDGGFLEHNRRRLFHKLFNVSQLEQSDRVSGQNNINACLEYVDAVFDTCFILIVLMLEVPANVVDSHQATIFWPA